MAKMKRKKRRMTGFSLVVVLTFALCIFGLSGVASLRRERDEKLEEKERLQAQIDEQRELSERLDIRRDYTGTKKFVEEMARKVLGLVYPDEILFEENQKEEVP